MNTSATWRAPNIVLALTGALVVAAALTVVVSGPDRAERADANEMHALLGGLGLGRATNLGRCVGAFDPRLGDACALRYHPLPGAEWACPDHALPRSAER